MVDKADAFTSEADLSRAVFDWLKVKRIFGWRMPVGPVVHRKMIRGVLREFWKKSPLKGFPDVAGVLKEPHRGVLFVLELKSKTGRVEPDQTAWLNDLSAAGVKTAVIRSIAELEAVFRDWQQIP